SRLARFVEGDYAPVVVLALVMIALGAYVLSYNSRYLSDFNINSVMFACAALGFISLGQTFALLLGGIDLSVGPLAGFLVVLASFFVLDGRSPGMWALGFVLMFVCAAAVGLLNAALIRFAKFTAVAATLVTYIGVGDPGQGTGYTLTSITAVVLGGTSLLGGRGTFIGTLMGAGLSVQVLNATVFLSLDQKWQYIFQGLLIVAAALIYSQVRRAGS